MALAVKSAGSVSSGRARSQNARSPRCIKNDMNNEKKKWRRRRRKRGMKRAEGKNILEEVKGLLEWQAGQFESAIAKLAAQQQQQAHRDAGWA